MNPTTVSWILSVASGITVAAAVAAARQLWKRTRVPTALSRSVARRSYVSTIRELSDRTDVHSLDAFTPALTPARRQQAIGGLQESWSRIQKNGAVRVVTGTSQSSLTTAGELATLGIEVRILSGPDTEELSYHLFRGDRVSELVVNYRSGDKNYPVRLRGISPLKVFQTDFESTWAGSLPFESVMAQRILSQKNTRTSIEEIRQNIAENREQYHLSADAEEAILLHVAFRRSAPVIFVVGLPGAGKSLVRTRLAAKLAAVRLQVEEVSDYVYAFRDFVHGALLLDSSRGSGFTAEPGGAFQVDNEQSLRPALQALAQRVWDNRRATKITLVEFARSDTLSALREFGEDILRQSQILHVKAQEGTRDARIRARAQPPTIEISQLDITISVSDNHRLPSAAAHNVYDHDDLDKLINERSLQDSVFTIDNDTADSTFEIIDDALEKFISKVVKPYVE